MRDFRLDVARNRPSRNLSAVLAGSLLVAALAAPAAGVFAFQPVVGSPGSTASPADGLSDSVTVEVARYTHWRSHFGLSADPTEIRALMLSPLDVGSAKWGIPMTAAELASLD